MLFEHLYPKFSYYKVCSMVAYQQGLYDLGCRFNSYFPQFGHPLSFTFRLL